MATWPSTLPAVDNDGYAIAPLDQVIRTDMEVGAARTRRRTKARNDKVTVSWLMTDAQLNIFRDWFEDAATGIAGGDAWFFVDLPLGGATFLESAEAKFVGAPRLDRARRKWRVSATLEVR